MFSTTHYGKAPIVKSFWANEEMGDLFLDGVVCVVDSRNVLKVCCTSCFILCNMFTFNQQLNGEKDSDEITECQKYVASSSRMIWAPLVRANDIFFRRQVASADVILLNKIDLVSEEHLLKVERAVRFVLVFRHVISYVGDY